MPELFFFSLPPPTSPIPATAIEWGTGQKYFRSATSQPMMTANSLGSGPERHRTGSQSWRAPMRLSNHGRRSPVSPGKKSIPSCSPAESWAWLAEAVAAREAMSRDTPTELNYMSCARNMLLADERPEFMVPSHGSPQPWGPSARECLRGRERGEAEYLYEGQSHDVIECPAIGA